MPLPSVQLAPAAAAARVDARAPATCDAASAVSATSIAATPSFHLLCMESPSPQLTRFRVACPRGTPRRLTGPHPAVGRGMVNLRCRCGYFKQEPLQPARPGGTEETAGLGLHEAHPLVHRLQRRLGRLAGL